MNFIKRAFIAITRKKVRSVILLVILLIIANLVLAGFTIQSATKEAGILARQKLGGTITLSYDSERAMQEQFSSDSGMRGRLTLQVEPVAEEDILKIAGLENIEAYNALVNTTAYAEGFEPVVPNEQDIDTSDRVETRTSETRREMPAGDVIMIEGMAEGPGGSFRIERNTTTTITQIQELVMPDIVIAGVTETRLVDDFKNQSSILIEGEDITANMAIENGAVIEKQLAVLNELSVGDIISIKATSDAEPIELNIIGIYETSLTTSGGGMNFNTSYTQPYNKIYVLSEMALNIKDIANGEEEVENSGSINRIVSMNTSSGIDSVTFTVDDPANMENIVTKIKALDIDWEKYKLDSNDVAYQEMMGPIENVASFSNIVILLVSIAGGVIIALILMLFIRERMYEAGILLSLGERRGKIVLQYMLEVLLIAIIAFSSSMLTGQFISQKVGDILLAQELEVLQEEESEQSRERGFNNGMMMTRAVMEEQDNVEPIDSIDISLSLEAVMKLYGVGICLVLVATIFPTIAIMRYNPRKILTNAG